MPRNASLYLWIKWCLLQTKAIYPPPNIKKTSVSSVLHLFLHSAVNMNPLKCIIWVFNDVALAAAEVAPISPSLIEHLNGLPT